MPPNRREQQLARARAARQAQRRQERARKRRLVAAGLIAILVVAGGGIGIAVAVSGGDGKSTVSPAATPSTSASASASTVATTVACNGKPQTLAKATRTFKAEPAITIDTKATYAMTLVTSCGPITISLEAAKAPHTVNLLSFLAGEHFYDGSYCHRSSASSGLTILQCGDPTNEDGTGQIGFTIAEENLTGATYPRGTLAMAKSSTKHSTASQFFLVDKDSQLPAEYTVAGHITKGLDVLDKLLAVGDDGSSPAGGGIPKQRIYLEKVTVTKA